LQFSWSHSQLVGHRWVFLDENNVISFPNGRMKKPIVAR
jgi:hypothetical protein